MHNTNNEIAQIWQAYTESKVPTKVLEESTMGRMFDAADEAITRLKDEVGIDDVDELAMRAFQAGFEYAINKGTVQTKPKIPKDHYEDRYDDHFRSLANDRA